MSEVKIKELDKSLIHRANSNSMSGQRGYDLGVIDEGLQAKDGQA